MCAEAINLQREKRKVFSDFFLMHRYASNTYNNTAYLVLGPGACRLLRLQSPGAQATTRYNLPYDSLENDVVL